MKRIITLIVGIFPCIVFGQNFIEDNFSTENGMINYSEAVQVDTSLTSGVLYLNARKWIVDAFKSSDVIQVDDKELNILIVKSFISKGHNAYVANPKNWFTLKIELRDGRYRYSLYDIRYEFYIDAAGQHFHTDSPFEQWIKPSDAQMSDKKRQKVNDGLNKYCKELNDEFVSIINSLKLSMSKIGDDTW